MRLFRDFIQMLNRELSQEPESKAEIQLFEQKVHGGAVILRSTRTNLQLQRDIQFQDLASYCSLKPIPQTLLIDGEDDRIFYLMPVRMSSSLLIAPTLFIILDVTHIERHKQERCVKSWVNLLTNHRSQIKITINLSCANAYHWLIEVLKDIVPSGFCTLSICLIGSDLVDSVDYLTFFDALTTLSESVVELTLKETMFPQLIDHVNKLISGLNCLEMLNVLSLSQSIPATFLAIIAKFPILKKIEVNAHNIVMSSVLSQLTLIME
ncbi:MAG: hypothetical protein JSR33_09655, partial [Proteobacteria bacterium]|nr:hypothetical protein [Pseudomonadota bacterium]